MSRGDVFRLYGKISRDIKENPETYNTGLVGEALIIASYKQMTISQLEKLRFIINRIISSKKGFKKQNENNDNIGNKSDAPDSDGEHIQASDRQ